MVGKPYRYKGQGLRVATFRDVTDLKKAEEALRESEKRYRNLFDNISDFIYSHDLDGRFLTINRAAAKTLGYSPEELIGKPVSDFMIPKYRQAFYEEYLVQIKKDGSYDGISTYLTKDEKKHYIEYRNILIEQENQESYISGLGRDITERMKSKLALQQSEERYRSLVENTLDGYFICEMPSGRFLFLNQRICDLCGYTMEEALQLSLWDVTDPDDHKIIHDRIKARMAGEEMSFATSIYRAIRKDGSTFRAEVSTSLITYQDKPVIQGVLRDVTERERFQMQLQQAEKLETIGTLAGGIAHDFNNLLMGIQGRASLMLMDTDSNHPHFDHLKGIEEYIKSAADLTKQLLGFARGGKYEVKPTDINELIKRSSEMFGRTKKEIVIHSKYQENIRSAEVDRGQIEQVLVNLYVNAWQSMPGGGELYLETQNVTLDAEYVKPFQAEPGRYVKISITDTGVGMDEATQKRIFEPFFTTKEMGRGTGLGLASVYGIIKNHGGFINVYSEKGQGTTFHIYIPASEAEVVEDKKSSMEVVRGEGSILLVDDEEMIIDVGKQLLENLGYRVMVAKSGSEAVTLYEKNKADIDMVILDMIIPGMGGGDTYDRLKEINPDIKVLLSSGYSIDGQGQEILDRGCNGFIQKPFDIQEISLKIGEILGKE
jgi:PAS domain S-box-containing protein